jgi:hypothetical protein
MTRRVGVVALWMRFCESTGVSIAHTAYYWIISDIVDLILDIRSFEPV